MRGKPRREKCKPWGRAAWWYERESLKSVISLFSGTHVFLGLLTFNSHRQEIGGQGVRMWCQNQILRNILQVATLFHVDGVARMKVSPLALGFAVAADPCHSSFFHIYAFSMNLSVCMSLYSDTNLIRMRCVISCLCLRLVALFRMFERISWTLSRPPKVSSHERWRSVHVGSGAHHMDLVRRQGHNVSGLITSQCRKR